MSKPLSYDRATEILDLIEQQVKDNEALKEYYLSMIKAAGEYTKMRFDWFFMTLTQQKEADDYRTTLHNAFLDACLLYCRFAEKLGLDASWYKKLSEGGRKVLGDLANYMTCFIGVSQR